MAVVFVLLCTLAAAPRPAAAAEPLSPEELTVLQELFTLGRSLEETRAAMDRVADQIGAVSRRQAEAAAERDRLEARRRDRQAQYNRRLRFYQEQGKVAPLAVLLGSSNFLDFLSRLDLLSQILEHDASLVRELRSLKTAVAAQEAALQSTSSELEELRSQLVADEAKLQAAITQRESTLAALKEQRVAVEAQLAALEQDWRDKAQPLLLALGATLQTVDPATFEPDQVNLSLFPPGATAIIAADSLTRFFHQVDALKGLAFRQQPGTLSMEGEFGGAAISISGQFVIADKTLLRYEPREIQIREFKVPTESIAELLAANHIDIDVTEMIDPWVLKSVEITQSDVRIRAGLK